MRQLLARSLEFLLLRLILRKNGRLDFSLSLQLGLRLVREVICETSV